MIADKKNVSGVISINVKILNGRIRELVLASVVIAKVIMIVQNLQKVKVGNFPVKKVYVFGIKLGILNFGIGLNLCSPISGGSNAKIKKSFSNEFIGFEFS